MTLRNRMIIGLTGLVAGMFVTSAIGIAALRNVRRSVGDELLLLRAATEIGNGLATTIYDEIRAAEQSVSQVGAGETGAPQVGAGEVGAGQVGAGQIGAAEVLAAQVGAGPGGRLGADDEQRGSQDAAEGAAHRCQQKDRG